MRLFILYGHHLFRQLPYMVNYDSKKITEAISIILQGKPFFASEWQHAPAPLINVEQVHQACKLNENEDYIDYPPSSQFPTRRAIVDNFINNYFLPAAQAVPQIAINGIINEVPITLRPPDEKGDTETLRPRKKSTQIK